jgi:hypothetical protein
MKEVVKSITTDKRDFNCCNSDIKIPSADITTLIYEFLPRKMVLIK